MSNQTHKDRRIMKLKISAVVLGAIATMSISAVHAGLKFDHTLTNTRAMHQSSVAQVIDTIAAVHQLKVAMPESAANVKIARNTSILGAHPTEDIRLLTDAMSQEQGPFSYRIDLTKRLLEVKPRHVGEPLIVTVFDPLFAGQSYAEVSMEQTPVSTPVPQELRQARNMEHPVSVDSGLAVMEHATTPVLDSEVDNGVDSHAAKELAAAVGLQTPTAPAEIEKMPAQTSSEPVAAEPVMAEQATPAPMVEEQPTPAPPVKMKLVIQKNQMLSDALRQFLEPLGWKLEWTLVQEDLMAGAYGEYVGESYVEVFNQILPKLGLVADIYNPSKVVVIKARTTP